MAPRLRTYGRFAAIAALAVLMSACLKLDIDFQVSEDDTVSGSMIFGVEKSLLELSGQSFDDFLGEEAPFPEDLEGVTVEDYEDDEFVGQRFTFEAVPLSELPTDDEEALSIVHEGDVYRVSGVLDLSTGLTGATGLSGFDPSEFLQTADLRVRISFPGEVTESNGEISGNTVTWTPVFGERLELQATASAVGGGGGGDSNLTLLLIIGAVVVVLAVVVGVIMTRRRKPAVAAAGAGMGDAGTPPPGDAGTPPTGDPGTLPPDEPPAPPPSAGPTPPPPPPPGPTDRL
jgi:hypothetical protein